MEYVMVGFYGQYVSVLFFLCCGKKRKMRESEYRKRIAIIVQIQKKLICFGQTLPVYKIFIMLHKFGKLASSQCRSDRAAVTVTVVTVGIVRSLCFVLYSLCRKAVYLVKVHHVSTHYQHVGYANMIFDCFLAYAILPIDFFINSFADKQMGELRMSPGIHLKVD